jgi:hypothetical protein
MIARSLQMKITRERLEQILKEELAAVTEDVRDYPTHGKTMKTPPGTIGKTRPEDEGEDNHGTEKARGPLQKEGSAQMHMEMRMDSDYMNALADSPYGQILNFMNAQSSREYEKAAQIAKDLKQSVPSAQWPKIEAVLDKSANLKRMSRNDPYREELRNELKADLETVKAMLLPESKLKLGKDDLKEAVSAEVRRAQIAKARKDCVDGGKQWHPKEISKQGSFPTKLKNACKDKVKENLGGAPPPPSASRKQVNRVVAELFNAAANLEALGEDFFSDADSLDAWIGAFMEKHKVLQEMYDRDLFGDESREPAMGTGGGNNMRAAIRNAIEALSSEPCRSQAAAAKAMIALKAIEAQLYATTL